MLQTSQGVSNTASRRKHVVPDLPFWFNKAGITFSGYRNSLTVWRMDWVEVFFNFHWIWQLLKRENKNKQTNRQINKTQHWAFVSKETEESRKSEGQFIHFWGCQRKKDISTQLGWSTWPVNKGVTSPSLINYKWDYAKQSTAKM